MDDAFQPGGRAPAPAPLDLVQDFVNTEIPEWARDDIARPDQLGRWFLERGLLAEGETVDAETFVAARALRTTLRGMARMNTLGGPTRDEPSVGVGSVLTGVRFGIEVGRSDELVLVPSGTAAERALASIVATVLEAQAAGTWARLKACRKETCGWLFYDSSRNRSSTWCSMTICGNRVKTASYRRRRGSS